MRYEYKPKQRKDRQVKNLRTIRFQHWIGHHWRLLSSMVVLSLLAVAAWYYVIVPYMAPPVQGNQFVILPALFTNGYSKVAVDADIIGDQGVVTLTSDCRQIVADVEPYQAESIVMGLTGTLDSRPDSHDIAADAFQSFGIEVLMVKIDTVVNDTYFGRIILRKGNDIEAFSARPSDATAIAVRMNASVYVNTTLLQDFGHDICGSKK